MFVSRLRAGKQSNSSVCKPMQRSGRARKMHPQNDRDERGTVRATGDKHQVVGEHWLGEGVLGALEMFCLICVESCGVCMCLLGSLSPPQVQ